MRGCVDKEYSRNSIWGTELHGADTLQKLERGDETGARPDRRVLRMSQVHGELVWTEERDQQSKVPLGASVFARIEKCKVVDSPLGYLVPRLHSSLGSTPVFSILPHP